jgi:hypothetical protein
MADRTWAWVKNLLVIAALALLNIFLTFPCGTVFVTSVPSMGGVQPLQVWYWVFAAPVVIAREIDSDWALPAIFINPLLYGLIWWGMWRMFRLMRAKPTEGDSPPLHNE